MPIRVDSEPQDGLELPAAATTTAPLASARSSATASSGWLWISSPMIARLRLMSFAPALTATVIAFASLPTLATVRHHLQTADVQKLAAGAQTRNHSVSARAENPMTKVP